MTSLPRKLGIALLLAAIVGFGLYVRAKPAAPLVFPAENEVRLLGADAYYHLRHTRFAVEHFPHVQRFDVGTHYPTGQLSRAAGLYDLSMATVALVVGGGDPSSMTVDRVVAWAPALLGALSILALFGLVRRVADAETALLACGVLTLYPGLFLGRTLLGFSDHHAAEVLLVVLSIWGVAADLRPVPRGRLGRWGAAFVHALPMAALLFTWAGAPVVLAVLVVALFVTALFETARGVANVEWAKRLLGYGAALFVLVGLVAAVRSELVLLGSLLWISLLAIACIALVIPAFLMVGRWMLARGVKPWLYTGGIVLLAVLGVWVVVQLTPRSEWLLHHLLGAKTTLVYEQNPVTWSTYWSSLGVPGVLGLCAPLVCAALAWRGEQPGAALFASLVGVLLIAMWWQVRDYDYFAAPMSAMLSALTIWAVVRLAASRRRGPAGDAVAHRRSRWRDVAYVAALLALAVPVWPVRAHPSPLPEPADVASLLHFHEGWAQAMAWMASETPEPTLPVNARIEPEDESPDFHYPDGSYGVIASWDFGNFVAAQGRRAPAASQGIDSRVSRWMLLSGDEQQTIDFWRDRLEEGERFRYVVIDSLTPSDHFATLARTANREPADFTEVERGRLPVYNAAFFRSIMARLYFGVGTGLQHYRLVYESPHETFMYYRLIEAGQVQFRLRSEPADSESVMERYRELRRAEVIRTGDGYVYGARLVPSIRIFEIVEGATLVGIVGPGVTVEASLLLRSGADGRVRRYEQSVRADGEGRFELTLPYATDGSSPSAIATEGPYAIDVDLGQGPRPWLEVELTESQISAGERIDLSAFTGGR